MPAAGENLVEPDGTGWAVEELSNQCTGYCPDLGAWGSAIPSGRVKIRPGACVRAVPCPGIEDRAGGFHGCGDEQRLLAVEAPRYMRRDYHPSKTGSTQQAIDYLLTSPAARAAGYDPY